MQILDPYVEWTIKKLLELNTSTMDSESSSPINYVSLASERVRVKGSGTTLFTKIELFRYVNDVCKAQQRTYQLVENRAKYFKVNCNSALKSRFIGEPGVCQFAVFAKAVLDENKEPTGMWNVYRRTECHTCDKTGSKRRAHDSGVLMSISSSLNDFVPNEISSLGSSRQVTNIARVSDGIDMRHGQAHNLIQMKKNTSMPVHIGQYFLLQSYFDLMEEKDKDGTFEIDVTECDWKEADQYCDSWRQFRRCYVAFGFSKLVWHRNCIDVVVADGTFTTSGVFKHTILLAVTKDGNNQLVLLAYCICDAENKSNWLYFGEQIRQDFHGMQVFLSDYDKGVECSEFQQALRDDDIAYARCVRHMLGNCGVNLKKKVTENVKKTVYAMARARTEDIYAEHLAKLSTIDPQMAEWWDTRKALYATHLFLKSGYTRYGNILNNMAEQFNSIIQELRGKPILDLCIGLNNYMFKKHTERATKAKSWHEDARSLTPYAWEKHLSMTIHAAKRAFRPHPTTEDGNLHCGLVDTDPFGASTASVFVSINALSHKQECPCYYYEEHGRPCRDTWKAIEHFCDDQDLTNWYDRVYHVDQYYHAYVTELPNISTGGKLRLMSILPPDANNMRGRPKKVRYESQSENPKKCHACGNFGHTQSTCQTPSTEVRVQKYFSQAVKYAKGVSNEIHID